MATSIAPANSTTVRANESLRLTALRLTFGVLDRVTPELAARLALQIWCSVPQGGRVRHDNRPHQGWLDTIALPGDRHVLTETWGEGPSVYLAHGWGGWRGQLGAFVKPLTSAGFEVTAFDVPGHGDSSPSMLGRGKGTAIEFAEALSAVADVHGTPTGVVAHSLGAAATALAMRDGLHVGRLAFVAPTSHPIAHSQVLADTLGYSEQTHQRFLHRLQRLAGRPLYEFDLDSMGTDGEWPQTLVVHDVQDRTVEYEEGRWLAEIWPSAQLVTTEGLGHQRILVAPDVVTHVTQFLTASQ